MSAVTLPIQRAIAALRETMSEEELVWLITAAPDLRDACKQALANIMKVGGDELPVGFLIEAIDKARGR